MNKKILTLSLCLITSALHAEPLRDTFVKRAHEMNADVIITLTTGEKIEGIIQFFDAVSMIVKPQTKPAVCLNRERVAAVTTKSKDIPIKKEDVDTSF